MQRLQLETPDSMPQLASMRGVLVREVHERLGKWDFNTLESWLLSHGMYEASEIARAREEYKKFLALTIHYRGVLIPVSGRVDPYWHGHILFTEDYTKLCHAFVGRYIHHRPAILDGQEALVRQFEDHTIPLYEGAFGPADRTWWNITCCSSGGL